MWPIKYYSTETFPLRIYFLKNAQKTCKPNNRDLNRDWITKSVCVVFHWKQTIKVFFWTVESNF